VVAAAVILPPFFRAPGLTDSKKLTAKRRAELYKIIVQKTQFSLGIADNLEIDQLGIKKATHLAMQRAVSNLAFMPDKLLVDGNDHFEFCQKAEFIIKGDLRIRSISAASVVAKVTRDQLMQEFDEQFPEYCFKQHQGYGTKLHYQLLKKLGPCKIHRQSFRLS
jgi:ribonuclease HII